MKTKCERYVQARLKGKGQREASRIAGYTAGRPSSAEKMYELVEKIREVPESATWVDDQIAEYEKKLDRLRRQKRAGNIARRLGVEMDSSPQYA